MDKKTWEQLNPKPKSKRLKFQLLGYAVCTRCRFPSRTKLLRVDSGYLCESHFRDPRIVTAEQRQFTKMMADQQALQAKLTVEKKSAEPLKESA